MSLTEPPPSEADDVDRPPSRRFTILFVLAMVLIAIGYAWVWQVKTSRVVVERVAPLILGPVTSRVPGHGPADARALRDSIAASILSIPGLSLARSVAEVQTPAGRLPPPVFAFDGTLERTADGVLELELRRTDARSDSLLYIHRVRGSTPAEVVHRMAVQIAMSFGLPLPVPGSESPGSPAARTR